MKTMNTRNIPFWLTYFPMLRVVLLGIGLCAATSQSANADEKPVTAEAPDAVEAEWEILQQKAMTGELTPEEEVREQWLGGQLMQRLLDSRKGRYALEGVVIDEDETPLINISLRISKENLIGFDKWKTDSEERNISGAFSVSARGYFGVRLTFNKEGYYEESIYFSAPGSDDIRKPQESAIDRRDIRIVLEKKGDITQLTEQDFKLTFRRQDGVSSGRVADLDLKKWALPFDDRYLYPIQVADLLDPEQLPPGCLYVLPNVNDDGHIASIDKADPNWHRPLMLPQELRLVLTDPDGGLIAYDQKEGEQAFWSMKRAPEEGYEQELVLDADWLFRRSRRLVSYPNHGIYFFFKVDGRYGKGLIETPQFIEGDYALEVKVLLQMQMDGTRNLDTGRR